MEHLRVTIRGVFAAGCPVDGCENPPRPEEILDQARGSVHSAESGFRMVEIYLSECRIQARAARNKVHLLHR
ncbi:hypothetical protein GCM10009651_10100 [Microbacterium natoriense]